MTKKILVVEDEKPLSKVLCLKLDHEGFLVTAAYDGEEAIDYLTKDESFDLILLDLVMPRKDGFDVLRDMKIRGDVTPVIVLSNLSQAGDIEKTKELGAKDFFIKSDTPISELVQLIRNHT